MVRHIHDQAVGSKVRRYLLPATNLDAVSCSPLEYGFSGRS